MKVKLVGPVKKSEEVKKDYELELWHKFREFGVVINTRSTVTREIADNIIGLKKKVRDEARRETLKEVKLYFFKKLEEIKKLTKGTKAKLVLYPDINDFYNWLEELEKKEKELKL